ncbi:polynucleotide 5'-hydroxyl-kinase nol9 [Arctopsyche grandis]|uniref:polynucleotide 5'-hydroxyl-kinase nol9 n=1 Tax=Arctopsyche grandis TaxID=121162 RepID=UPI00406D964F
MYSKKVFKHKQNLKTDENNDDVVFVKEFSNTNITNVSNKSKSNRKVVLINDSPVSIINNNMKSIHKKSMNFKMKGNQSPKIRKKKKIDLIFNAHGRKQNDKLEYLKRYINPTQLNVESKATTPSESNMIGVISNIVSPSKPNKINNDKNKPTQVKAIDNEVIKKIFSKNVIEPCNNVSSVALHTGEIILDQPLTKGKPPHKKRRNSMEHVNKKMEFTSEPSGSEMNSFEKFDSDGVLAQKIKERLNRHCAKRTKTKSQQLQNIPKKIPDIILCEDSSVKRKPLKNMDFVDSVVEVFDKNYTNKNVTFNTVNETPYNSILHQDSACEIISNEIIMLSDNEYAEEDVEILDDSVIILNDEELNDTNELSNTESPQKSLQKQYKYAENLNANETYKFHIVSNLCILIIEKSTKVYFCGKLKASLLYGHIEVLGHKLNKEPCELYSIVTSNLLCFESFVGNDQFDELALSLGDLGIPSLNLGEILKDVTQHSAVLLLKPHNNIMTQFISKHLTTFDILSNVKNANRNVDVFNLLQCNFFTGINSGIFVKNNIWDQIVEAHLLPINVGFSRNVTLLCGGKNAGKSTMLRYIVNKLLTKGPVLVLDLDPGQPEFTVCGLVSATIVKKPLLGPNFTHLQDTERSYSIGLINVVENADRYLNAVGDLCEFLQGCDRYKNIPWIVNTMGFTNALGLKFLTAILSICKPSAVVEIQHPLLNNNFPMKITNENINVYKQSEDFTSWTNYKRDVLHNYKYFECPTFQQKARYMTKPFIRRNLDSKTERVLNVIAYFSKMVSTKSLSLLNLQPNVISTKDIKLAMNYIMIQQKYLINILNGRLVALCYDEEYTRKANTTNVFILGKSPVECFGYGLIRGVDPVKDTLYILTPLDSNVLNKVNMLVYAETLPDCCGIFSAPHLSSNTMIPYTAPIKITSKNRHLHQIPRRKFNPLRLLYIARNSA